MNIISYTKHDQTHFLNLDHMQALVPENRTGTYVLYMDCTQVTSYSLNVGQVSIVSLCQDSARQIISQISSAHAQMRLPFKIIMDSKGQKYVFNPHAVTFAMKQGNLVDVYFRNHSVVFSKDIYQECLCRLPKEVGEEFFQHMKDIAQPHIIQLSSQGHASGFVNLRDLQCLVPDSDSVSYLYFNTFRIIATPNQKVTGKLFFLNQEKTEQLLHAVTSLPTDSGLSLKIFDYSRGQRCIVNVQDVSRITPAYPPGYSNVYLKNCSLSVDAGNGHTGGAICFPNSTTDAILESLKSQGPR